MLLAPYIFDANFQTHLLQVFDVRTRHRGIKKRSSVLLVCDEYQTGQLLFALLISDDDFHNVFVKLSPGVFS